MSTPPLNIAGRDLQTIYDLFDLMRERPGMWIGEPSITRLYLFIEGFEMGLRAAQRSFVPETPNFGEFHDWIAARLHRRKNGHGWCDMLLDDANGKEAAAFDRFWIELDAFRRR